MISLSSDQDYLQGHVLSTKVGIISDVHATPGLVEEALKIFRQQGKERLLCAGDVAGYGEALNVRGLSQWW